VGGHLELWQACVLEGRRSAGGSWPTVPRPCRRRGHGPQSQAEHPAGGPFVQAPTASRGFHHCGPCRPGCPFSLRALRLLRSPRHPHLVIEPEGASRVPRVHRRCVESVAMTPSRRAMQGRNWSRLRQTMRFPVRLQLSTMAGLRLTIGVGYPASVLQRHSRRRGPLGGSAVRFR